VTDTVEQNKLKLPEKEDEATIYELGTVEKINGRRVIGR
jgi:hypothetical protein